MAAFPAAQGPKVGRRQSLNSSAANNPAASSADRISSLKIASVQGLPAGVKSFVKISTSHGLVGWGELTGIDPAVSVPLLNSLAELLIDENPTRIEYLWQRLFRAHRDMRGGPQMVHAISAIDMALWDIAGKFWGLPMYRLLGGAVRDKIRIYPSPTAVKAGTTGGPQPFSASPQDVEQLVRGIRATRERLGPEAAIMFDAHCALPPPMLIQFAAEIEPLDVLFIEEPAVPGNIEVFKRLKAAIRVPLATGERDRTIWEMLPYLEERCIDILQPDCGHTGGITQMKKIATLAEAYFVPLAPHSAQGELGLSASLHATATVPLLLIHEGYLSGGHRPLIARKHFEVDQQGYASLPEGPGLGVDIDEAAIAAAAADPSQKFHWPVKQDADGSIRDY